MCLKADMGRGEMACYQWPRRSLNQTSHRGRAQVTFLTWLGRERGFVVACQSSRLGCPRPKHWQAQVPRSRGAEGRPVAPVRPRGAQSHVSCPECGHRTVCWGITLGVFSRPTCSLPRALVHRWGSLHPRSISELGAGGEDRCRVAGMQMCLSHGLVMEFVSPCLVPSPQLLWLSPQPLGLPLQINLIGIFLATHNLSSSKAPSNRGLLVRAGSGRTWPPSIQGWMHYMGASWTEEETSKLGTTRSEGCLGYEQSKSIVCRWGSCSSEEQACRGQCWEGTSVQGPRRGGGTGTQKQSKAEQGGHKRGTWPEAGRQGPGVALWTAMPGLGCGSQTDGVGGPGANSKLWATSENSLSALLSSFVVR